MKPPIEYRPTKPKPVADLGPALGGYDPVYPATLMGKVDAELAVNELERRKALKAAHMWRSFD